MTTKCLACGEQLAQVLIDAREEFHVICSPQWPPVTQTSDQTRQCALCTTGVPDPGRGICPACDQRTRHP